MIVIGQALVGVSMEHHLDGVMVIVRFAVVMVLVKSDGKNRYTSDRP